MADQRGAPTWSRLIASAVASMVVAVDRRGAVGERAALGTYHLTAAGSTTWHGFAERIVELARGSEELACREVIAIDSAELESSARRPAMSLLSCDKAERAFGVRLPAWEDQLKMVLAP